MHPPHNLPPLPMPAGPVHHHELGGPKETASVKRRRTYSIALGVLASVLVAIAVLGVVSSAFGVLILDPISRHRHALVLAGLACAFVGTLVWPTRTNAMSVVRALIAAGFALLFGFGAMWAAFMAMFGESSRHESPDRSRVLVVSEGAAMIDPLWFVSVEETDWFLVRSTLVACFNGHNPDDALKSVKWVKNTTVEMVTESGTTHRVTVGDLNQTTPDYVSVGCDGRLLLPPLRDAE